MQGVGVPVVGNPPTGAFPGLAHGTSIGPPRRLSDSSAFAGSFFITASTLPCSFFGSFGPGHRGVAENVSSSEAQVSNTTGDGCDLDAGAANSVNLRQINASEFSVIPSTGPA